LETSWKPGLPTRVGKSFQLVRLVGCGLNEAVKRMLLQHWANR